MQVALPNRDISRSNGATAAQFQINQANMAKLAAIFIAGQYESKSRFVPELVANAYDAAPGEAPVVHLPTRLEPWFEVRDTGPGMSHEFMMNGYTWIGNSTKDQDDDQLGGFGWGRLSALGVAESYIVESIYGDEANLYVVVAGKQGVPELTHELRRPRSPDEPTGVRVNVPVPSEYVTEVRDEGVRTLRFFDPPPVSNVTIDPVKVNIDGGNVVLAEINAPTIIMGGYPYPIDVSQIPNHKKTPAILSGCYEKNHYYSQIKSHVLIKANPGDVDPTSNRERLKYTDKTISFLVEASRELPKLLAKKLIDEVNTQPTKWDAAVHYNNNLRNLPRFVKESLDGVIEYNGEINFHRIQFSSVVSQKGHPYRNSYRIHGHLSITPTGNEVFYYNDIPRNGLSYFREAAQYSDYLIRDLAQVPEGVTARPLSSLPAPAKVQLNFGPKGPRAKVRLRTYDGGKFVISEDQPSSPSGAYVDLVNDNPQQPIPNRSNWFYPKDIFGVPKTWKGDRSALVPVHDFMVQTAVDYLNQNPVGAWFGWNTEYTALTEDERGFLDFLLQTRNRSPIAEKFGKLLPNMQPHNYQLTQLRESLIDLNITLPAQTHFGLKKLVQRLMAKNPIVSFVTSQNFSHRELIKFVKE